jgi:hypothetical protein
MIPSGIEAVIFQCSASTNCATACSRVRFKLNVKVHTKLKVKIKVSLYMQQRLMGGWRYIKRHF